MLGASEQLWKSEEKQLVSNQYSREEPQRLRPVQFNLVMMSRKKRNNKMMTRR